METVSLEIFARRLKRLREQNGLTTRELGEIVGVSNATISRYETGQRDPDLLVVNKLSQHFGVTIGYLCGEDISTNTENLLLTYSKLSEESRKEAIKYLTYLNEKEEK